MLSVHGKFNFSEEALIRLIKDNDTRRTLIKNKVDGRVIDAFHGETGILMEEGVRQKLIEIQKSILDSSTRPLYSKGQPGPKVLRELAVNKLFYRFERHGESISSEDILICEQSSTHWLDNAMLSLAKQTSSPALLCPEGFYKSNGAHAAANGIEIISVPTNSDYKLDPYTLDNYCSKYGDSVCGLLMTYPGNPFLVNYSFEELSGIAEVVVKNDLRVICDSAFQEMQPDNIPFGCIEIFVQGALHHMKDRTATIAALSKGHNAPGTYKIGAILCPNKEWREQISRLSPQNIQREATMLSKVILSETSDAYFSRNRELMKEQKQIMVELIEQINLSLLTEWPDLEGDAIEIVGHNEYGMFACITFSEQIRKQAKINDSLQLCEFLLADARIDSVALARTGAEASSESEIPPAVRLNVLSPGICYEGGRSLNRKILCDLFAELGQSAKNIRDGITYSRALEKLGIDETISVKDYYRSPSECVIPETYFSKGNMYSFR